MICVRCRGKVVWDHYEFGWFMYCINCGRDKYPDYKGTGDKRPSGRTETTPVFKGDKYHATTSQDDYNS